MKAVPENAQANGNIYQGEIAIRYKLKAMAMTEVATAPHALSGFISKTCTRAERDQLTVALRKYQLEPA